jgi:hypothetical protein
MNARPVFPMVTMTMLMSTLKLDKFNRVWMAR